jgi:L-histidine N-alpha-methyltransferase
MPGSSTDFAAQYLRELRADVAAGLAATPKSLPPKYFYDARGSELFDEITQLPEYYPTRAETAILTARAGEIAGLARCTTLVELGSGTSAKTRLLLRALRDAGWLQEFVPLDVDPAVLAQADAALQAEYPGLRISPFAGDFERDLAAIPRSASGRATIAFLGSTIGNLEPAARAAFLRHVAQALKPGDTFLLGTDLVKDAARLQRAYDDAAGVTAEFNRNVLRVVNRELDADFAVEQFEHVALWDACGRWRNSRSRYATWA